MKKKTLLPTLILSLVMGSTLFAEETGAKDLEIVTHSPSHEVKNQTIGELKPSSDPIERPQLEGYKDNFVYLRLGATSVDTLRSVYPVPDITIGRRFEKDNSAIDLSVSIAYGYDKSRDEKSFLFNLPKMQYLYYNSPQSTSSVYFGGGLGYTGLWNKKTDTRFQGISTNGVVGYEFSRKSRFWNALQLEVIQPTIGINRIFDYIPPSASLTYSFGF